MRGKKRWSGERKGPRGFAEMLIEVLVINFYLLSSIGINRQPTFQMPTTKTLLQIAISGDRVKFLPRLVCLMRYDSDIWFVALNFSLANRTGSTVHSGWGRSLKSAHKHSHLNEWQRSHSLIGIKSVWESVESCFCGLQNRREGHVKQLKHPLIKL